jgi:hypothetical protein
MILILDHYFFNNLILDLFKKKLNRSDHFILLYFRALVALQQSAK